MCRIQDPRHARQASLPDKGGPPSVVVVEIISVKPNTDLEGDDDFVPFYDNHADIYGFVTIDGETFDLPQIPETDFPTGKRRDRARACSRRRSRRARCRSGSTSGRATRDSRSTTTTSTSIRWRASAGSISSSICAR